MIRRIFSTIFLWSLLGTILFFLGTTGGVCLLILAAALTQYELYQLMERIGGTPYKCSATLLGIFFLLHTYAQPIGLGMLNLATIAIASVFVVYATVVTLTKTPDALVKSLLPTVFGFIYVPVLFTLPIEFIRNGAFYSGSQTTATLLIVWMILVVKCADVGGLLIGCSFGKQPIAPAWSPKKTYEGLWGSLLFSILAGIIFKYSVGHRWPTEFSLRASVAVATILSFFSLVSDLVESGLKRLANVKDSGHLIPGIGGIFDLTDSLMLTLPLGVILLKTLILT